MKTMMKTYLPAAAWILTVALAGPAVAQNSCADTAPGCFKGIFEGQDAIDIVQPGATSVVIRTIATGSSTHMGRFFLIREITGSLVTFTQTGSAQWVAANRDSIRTTIAGSAAPTPDGKFLHVTETHTITGGTGRFAGAQGSFKLEFFHEFEPSGVAGTVETHDIVDGSFSGTLTLPGGAK